MRLHTRGDSIGYKDIISLDDKLAEYVNWTMAMLVQGVINKNFLSLIHVYFASYFKA